MGLIGSQAPRGGRGAGPWIAGAILAALLLLLVVSPFPRGLASESAPATSPATATAPAPAPTARAGAPVVLAGRNLFSIQADIGSFSPEFRARVVSERIDQLARERDVPLDQLNIVVNEAADTVDIRSGRRVLLTVAAVDAVAAGKSQQALALAHVKTIREAVGEYRDAHRLSSILRGLLYSFIATGVLIALMVAVLRSAPKLTRRLVRWRGTRIRALTILGTEVLSAGRVVDLLTEIIRVVRLTILVILCLVYINFVLSFFPWTLGFSRILVRYIQTAAATLGSSLLSYLPNLFFLAIITLVTSYILKIFKFISSEIANGTIVFAGFHADWARPTYKLVQFLVFAFAATIAFPYLPGAGTPAFQGISIFLGVLVSLGSSSAISNIVAGVILVYTRSFQPGDRVQISDTVGDVVGRNLFVTRLRSIKNVVISIPNAAVLGSHVINYSSAANDPETPPLILYTTVTIGYDVPWRQVHEVLIQAALAVPDILRDPRPFILQTSLDDFFVSYQLNAYTDRPGVMASIYSDIHQNIQDFCARADIEILSPHYRAMRNGNPSTIPAEVPPP
ncbi:mechanosensitive ion channel family protein [Synechococcus sp. CCY 9618]|uniref:mechanosensitive ion channel family protein n=1 Tax=Synechococcus sp. CCY 9618 TaxID=2815602 RepID=UPI001C235D86|nr:mechanosensitive ion channel domain-containing protein [Synechococcus sp. CCY 9618]